LIAKKTAGNRIEANSIKMSTVQPVFVYFSEEKEGVCVFHGMSSKERQRRKLISSVDHQTASIMSVSGLAAPPFIRRSDYLSATDYA
jgi:hypothetical protein